MAHEPKPGEPFSLNGLSFGLKYRPNPVCSVAPLHRMIWIGRSKDGWLAQPINVLSNPTQQVLTRLLVPAHALHVSILQYADDTILFMKHDTTKAVNMKLMLCIFEQLSGLKINFHKSEIFCFGEAKEMKHQ